MALTALQVRNAKPGDKLSDGGGLRLDADARGGCSWVFRFKSPVTGKERYMGLGPASDVSLVQAREAAQAARQILREGNDPIEQRNEKRATARTEAAKATTFRMFAEEFIAIHKLGWRNAKHAQQWENSLRTYAFPLIGDVSVGSVTTDDVIKVLTPVWMEKRETAARIRGRIEQIMNAAAARKIYSGVNPALHVIVKHLLPAQKRKGRVTHHASLPYEEMPKFWKSLAAENSNAAGMLRWIILTVCRYNEARFLDQAAEVKDNLWSIPAYQAPALMC